MMPMAEQQRFRREQIQDVLMIELADPRLFDTLAISELEEQMLAVIDQVAPKKVLVNFESVVFCSTSVINGLLRAKKKLLSNGGQLKLCSMRDTVREAYRILNLDGTVFEIYNDRRAALADFGIPS